MTKVDFESFICKIPLLGRPKYIDFKANYILLKGYLGCTFGGYF
jgi:hypothetical protein